MKSNKILVVGLIGLLLAGGLILLGCDLDGCPGGSNPQFKAGYGVGSDKGGCTFNGRSGNLLDCSKRCVQKYADKYPNATSFSCDC